MSPTVVQTAPPAPDPTDLERRVLELEAALRQLQGELAAQRAAAATVPAQVASTPPPAPAPRTAAAGALTDGFRVGSTTVRLSGFVKVDGLASAWSDGDTATTTAGRDYYLPSNIPVGGLSSDAADFDIHAKQTRFVLTTATPAGDQTITAHIEADFQTAPGTQGSERTTNGYNFALRRAFISYGAWTIGQDWTNFMHTAVMPETTDLIGPTEGVIFIRQPQLRWRHPLSERLTLFVSAENPETASATPISSALVENDDDSAPDLTAKLVYAAPFGEFSLAALGRRLSVDGPGGDTDATGWGVSAGGKVPFSRGSRNDFRFQITHGDGIGRYLGVNFAPDAILNLTPGGLDLETVSVTAGYASARWFWTDKMRSTLMVSAQDVDSPAGLTAPDSNAAAWSIGANLFYSPVPGFDLGIEYRHGEREIENGQQGALDRLHVVAKQNF